MQVLDVDPAINSLFGGVTPAPESRLLLLSEILTSNPLPPHPDLGIARGLEHVEVKVY